MNTRTRMNIGRWIGVGVVIAAFSTVEAKGQYGPRAQPITGVRTGLRYQPSLPSPFAASGFRGPGFASTSNLSRFGGFYGSPVGFSGGGFSGYPGIGFGNSGFSSFSVNIGFGGLGFRNAGYSVSSFGVGGIGGFGGPIAGPAFYSTPGYGFGYPSIYGRAPYGSVGFTSVSYGAYPYGGVGYVGFPYGYGYGYRGGYFGY